MKKRFLLLAISFFLFTGIQAATVEPQVYLYTNMGKIVLKLNSRAAPVTVKNFLKYVEKGFFNGTVFHRVIPGFMIQGGGLTPALERKKGFQPIPNEANNGLKNEFGTIAMARTQDPHSATSQFFINTAKNDFLNFQEKTQRGWGYCVFGKVISGLDVVKKIEKIRTGFRAGRRDVPLRPVIIEKAELVAGK